jgi:hypothetical protein
MGLKFIGLRELEQSYRLAAKLCQKAESRAVKRAGTTIIAAQSRAIAQRINLKVGTIKEQIRIVQQPTPDAPRVVFEVRFKGIPLALYGARQTKRGVSVTTVRGKRTLLTAAFYSPKSKAFLGRASNSDDRRYGSPHVGRLPVLRLWGPSVYQEYVSAEVQKIGNDTWTARIEIELNRETDFALRSAGLI